MVRSVLIAAILVDFAQGEGGGVAPSEVVPEERAEELHLREGGGGRGAVPPEGGFGGVRRVRAAAERVAGDVLVLHYSYGSHHLLPFWVRLDV